MDTRPDQELTTIYADYLQEAKRVMKGQTRAGSPFRLGIGIIGIILMLGALFGKLPPMDFWWGVIIVLIGFVLSLFFSNRYARKEVSQTAQSRPGFSEFYKLYSSRRWWPDGMVAGEKLDKFLSILGRKGTG